MGAFYSMFCIEKMHEKVFWSEAIFHNVLLLSISISGRFFRFLRAIVQTQGDICFLLNKVKIFRHVLAQYSLWNELEYVSQTISFVKLSKK